MNGEFLDLGRLTPEQAAFCQSKARYTAFGGARGGGKSHVIRVKAIMGALRYPGIRILMVRRDRPELEQSLIIPMRKLIPPELAVFVKPTQTFVFSNGSIIRFGKYGDEDERKYCGQSCDWIFMDEATQFTEDQSLVLCHCLHGKRHIPKRMYLTVTSRSGPGVPWVKRLFVDRDFRDGEDPEEYAFIKSFSRDNPNLPEEYVRQLETLPPDLRAAWLDGEWAE